MELDDFIITVFCAVDDRLKPLGRLRQRGPKPQLADSEVVTMELVGEFLGLDTDQALYSYFRRHYNHFFPTLRELDRTTFVRQAANLGQITAGLWQRWVQEVPHTASLRLLDSVPIPVCRFRRAHFCQRFRGQAAFGYDELARAIFYGFRGHLGISPEGVICAWSLAPANVHDLQVVPELTPNFQGSALGDRNYWGRKARDELLHEGVSLYAPFKRRSQEPHPRRARQLGRVRQRIETVLSQLVGRFRLKRVWARDLWHLGVRLWRKLLSHTVAVWINVMHGRAPLQLDGLITV